MKKVLGGLLVQEYDAETYDPEKLVCVTERKPTEKEMEDLNFAWKVVKHTKSNAIVLAKDNMTTGVGPGQTNRVLPTKIAIDYAGERAKGSVLASDAFSRSRTVSRRRQRPALRRLSSRAARSMISFRSTSVINTASRWYFAGCATLSIKPRTVARGQAARYAFWLGI